MSLSDVTLLLFFFLLLVVIFVVAVRDLLGHQRKQVRRFDLADGARQLVALAVHVLAVDAVAVASGQGRLGVYVHVRVLHRGLVGHLRKDGEKRRKREERETF